MKLWLRHLAPRRMRRVLVLAYFLLSLQGLVVLFLGVGGVHRELEVMSWLGVMVCFLLGRLFYLVTPTSDIRSEGLLDERQNLVQLRAFASAYQIVCSLFAACYIAFILLDHFGYELRKAGSLGEFLYYSPFLPLMIFLPQSLVAWREPDLPDIEEAAPQV